MTVQYRTVQVPVPGPAAPGMTPGMTGFFDSEVNDYSANVRQGNIDPSDGFHPTLASAVDSLQQAPEDVILSWFGLEGDEDTDTFTLFSFALDLANLVLIYGATTPLTAFLEGA